MQRLIQFLVERGYSFSSALARETTGSFATFHVEEALRYLHKNDGGEADRCLSLALDTIEESDNYSLLEWTDHGQAFKRVCSLDAPLDEQLRSNISCHLIIKEYFTDTLPLKCDGLKAAQLNKLYDALAREPSAPLAEISAITPKRFLSVRSGKNLAFETKPDESLRTQILADTQYFTEWFMRNERFMASAKAEQYPQKFAQSLEILLPDMGVSKDARLLRQEIRDHHATYPQIDLKAPNCVIDDGKLRYIDLEKALSVLVTDGHRDAHVWFDPYWNLNFEQRCSGLGEENFYDAFYYLVRQVANAARNGVRVPFHMWAKEACRRVDSYAQNLRELCLLPHFRAFESAERLADLEMPPFEVLIGNVRHIK